MADNNTVGRVYTMMCPRPAPQLPPGTPELKPWDGVHRSSPIDEYIKKAQGGLDPAAAGSWHYQQSLSVQDAAIGEVLGAGLVKVLGFASRLVGFSKGVAKAPARVPEPTPKPPEPPTAKLPESPTGTSGVVVRSSTDKAAFGERAAHDKMVQKGHEPIGKTDGSYVEGHKGIDGVYKNANPPPDYIITEVKAGEHAKLTKGLADGTNQMDDVWVQKMAC